MKKPKPRPIGKPGVIQQDITLCTNKKCGVRTECYRGIEVPEGAYGWQSMSMFPGGKTGCDYYIRRIFECKSKCKTPSVCCPYGPCPGVVK